MEYRLPISLEIYSEEKIFQAISDFSDLSKIDLKDWELIFVPLDWELSEQELLWEFMNYVLSL